MEANFSRSKLSGMLRVAICRAHDPAITVQELSELTGRSQQTVRIWLRKIREMVEDAGLVAD